MRDEFFNDLTSVVKNHTPSWLVTVIGCEGSTPGRLGMKCLLKTDGSLSGTIGGGNVEHLVIERIKRERPREIEKWKYTLGLEDEDAIKTGMICGGVQEVLVEPLHVGDPLWIIGGGHCGIALSALASTVGFSVQVVDNREDWANRERHPKAMATHVVQYHELLDHIAPTPDSFIVIMTHGCKHDSIVLRQLLTLSHRYIGVIGSRTKVKTMFEHLMETGVSRSELEKVFAPIGLPFGTHTTQEIAISILAQLMTVRSGLAELRINSNPLL